MPSSSEITIAEGDVIELVRALSLYRNRVNIAGPFEWQTASNMTETIDEASRMLDELVEAAAPRTQPPQQASIKIEGVEGCETVGQVREKIEKYKTNPFNIKKQYVSLEEAMADLETADMAKTVPLAYKVYDVACITRYKPGKANALNYFETEVYIGGIEDRFDTLASSIGRTRGSTEIMGKKVRFPVGEDRTIIIKKAQDYMFTMVQENNRGDRRTLTAHMTEVKQAFETYILNESSESTE